MAPVQHRLRGALGFGDRGERHEEGGGDHHSEAARAAVGTAADTTVADATAADAEIERHLDTSGRGPANGRRTTLSNDELWAPAGERRKPGGAARKRVR
ncbi:hypothetical protein [Candidatus Palauibacter sp.]|uniref:hypothetical protein n=1 Tax=Candidatus Palauibacter sp. TaxID=3101350 RepID=UPI003B026CAB